MKRDHDIVAKRLAVHGEAHLFGRRPDLLDDLQREADVLQLVANELVDIDPIADWVVRRGRLRLAEFLDDGREMTRGVLEAGSCFVTRSEDDFEGLPRDLVTVMALGDTELWRCDPDTFRRHHVR